MFASWTPGDDMIRTGYSGRVEHVIAYALSGAVACAVLAGRHATGYIAAAIVVYAALLEFGQLFVPGRHADLVDFLSSAAGAVIGVSAYIIARGFASVRLADRKAKR